MRTIYSFLFVIFCIQSSLFGQDEEPPLFSAEFNEATIDRFVDELISKTGYHFYYDARQFDSLRINLMVKNEPLEKILDRAFLNTGFSFSIDQHKNVFFVKGRAIKTDLPAGFFGRKKNAGDTSQNNIADAQSDSVKEVTGTRLENKLYEIGRKTNDNRTAKATIAGFVRDDKTGEA